MNEILEIKRALGYWIPGKSVEEMRALVEQNQIKPFDKEEFIQNVKSGCAQVHTQDDRHLSETEKAFRLAFNPDKRIRSDYECMFFAEEKNEMEIEAPVQKCENPQCQGTDTKWIECTKGRCWYHQSCAGIPMNKTSEEIDQMEWICKKCKNIGTVGKKR